MSVEVVEESEGLEDIIEEMIRVGVAKIHVGCWARVTAYNATKQTCSCRPVVRASIKGGDPVKYPIITNVPVRFPAGGAFSMTWPIEAGDQVWLDFSDRSIDEWMNGSDPSDITPASKRRFHISDAVAYPGGRPGAKPLARADTDDLVIGQDEYKETIDNPGDLSEPLQLRIGPTGIALGDGTTTNDLFNVLFDLIAILKADAPQWDIIDGSPTAGEALPFTKIAFGLLQDRLDTIRRP